MGVRVVDGDLLTSKAKYICHQVNCQGKMGSGVARAIREKFPTVYAEYSKLCCSTPNKSDLLGVVQTVHCRVREREVNICNLFGQLNYGYNGKQFTNYDAFIGCLQGLKRVVPENETIAMPFKIGCGLGGADWEVVSNIIRNELGESYDVELWRLSEKC